MCVYTSAAQRFTSAPSHPQPSAWGLHRPRTRCRANDPTCRAAAATRSHCTDVVAAAELAAEFAVASPVNGASSSTRRSSQSTQHTSATGSQDSMVTGRFAGRIASPVVRLPPQHLILEHELTDLRLGVLKRSILR